MLCTLEVDSGFSGCCSTDAVVRHPRKKISVKLVIDIIF